MDYRKIEINTLLINYLSLDSIATLIMKWSREDKAKFVCLSNVHMCMEAKDHQEFRKLVNSANLVLPDGRPIVWALRLFGFHEAKQIRGADLMVYLCKKAEKAGIPVGFFGGSSECLLYLKSHIKKHFPSLRISIAESPPTSAIKTWERFNYSERINTSGAKIIFIGLGCPKQEEWMYQNRNKIKGVMVGVGAAFDFIGGRKRQAPKWIQKAGFEWFFRLSTEPVRLWNRYLKHNPRFILYLFYQYLKLQFYKHRSN